jgi:hypothetical protein
MSEDQLQALDHGLLQNALDSLHHALSHCVDDGDPWHRAKWIHLSAAHAAELVCNYLLVGLNGRHPERYPSLGTAVELLQAHKHQDRLHPSALLLVPHLAAIENMRHRLMHRCAPDELDLGPAALAILGLLHFVGAALGIPSSAIYSQDPPIELSVFEHLGWREHEKWFSLAESLLEHRRESLSCCDSCGRWTVEPGSGRCLACFSCSNNRDY